jgi:hypothetical protein
VHNIHSVRNLHFDAPLQPRLVAFDLYRFDLLNALHLPLPQDQKSEIQANKKLTEFFLLGTDPEWCYDNSNDGQVHSK